MTHPALLKMLEKYDLTNSFVIFIKFYHLKVNVVRSSKRLASKILLHEC